jgi:hypothetical protein
VTVRTGEPGRIEGSAGSRFIEIPVTIEARTTADSTQRFAGTYALRRAVVDGASEAQRRWHIYSAGIHACAATGCAPTGASDSDAQIEVAQRRAAQADGDAAWTVDGDIIYVSSTDTIVAVDRKRVTPDVRRSGGEWRIGRWGLR